MSRNRLIGVALTLLFLGLAFYRVDLGEMVGALRTANYSLLAPAAICTLMGYLLRTVRWRLILSQSVQIRFPSLFGILMIGFATNNLVPARLGELARAYLGRQRTGVRKTFFIATIFLERVFDGLVLIVILLGLSTRLSLPEWGKEVQLASTLVFIGLAGGIAFILARQHLALALLGRAAGRLPERVGFWMSSAFEMFLMGLESMRRFPRVGAVGLISCTIWLLEGLSYYLLALGFDLPLSPLRLVAAVALLPRNGQPRHHDPLGSGLRWDIPVLRSLRSERFRCTARDGVGARSRVPRHAVRARHHHWPVLPGPGEHSVGNLISI